MQQQQPLTPAKVLAGAQKGKKQRPWRMLVYGVEGVGKSTLAAASPSPLFIGEDGVNHLDAARLPVDSWTGLRVAVRALATEQHDYKTVVFDTVDWIEPLNWAFCCQRDEEKSIEGYGYGKGYVAAASEWGVLLSDLERLQRDRGLNVMLLGHCQQKTFKNPVGEDFDRYELKLNPKASGLLKEWCDAVLFANHEEFTKKDERTKRVRGVSTGARWLHTNRTAAFDAKNRFGFPEALPLQWADVEAAMAASVVDVPTLVAELKRKAAQLGGDDEKKVEAAIGRANGDAVKLGQLNTWCNAQLTLKAQAAEKAA